MNRLFLFLGFPFCTFSSCSSLVCLVLRSVQTRCPFVLCCISCFLIFVPPFFLLYFLVLLEHICSSIYCSSILWKDTGKAHFIEASYTWKCLYCTFTLDWQFGNYLKELQCHLLNSSAALWGCDVILILVLCMWTFSLPFYKYLKSLRTTIVEHMSSRLPWWSTVNTLSSQCRGSGFDPWSGD